MKIVFVGMYHIFLISLLFLPLDLQFSNWAKLCIGAVTADKRARLAVENLHERTLFDGFDMEFLTLCRSAKNKVLYAVSSLLVAVKP